MVRAAALEGYVRICFAQYLLLLEKQRKISADPNQKSGARSSLYSAPSTVFIFILGILSSLGFHRPVPNLRTPDQYSSPSILSLLLPSSIVLLRLLEELRGEFLHRQRCRGRYAGS